MTAQYQKQDCADLNKECRDIEPIGRPLFDTQNRAESVKAVVHDRNRAQ